MGASLEMLWWRIELFNLMTYTSLPGLQFHLLCRNYAHMSVEQADRSISRLVDGHSCPPKRATAAIGNATRNTMNVEKPANKRSNETWSASLMYQQPVRLFSRLIKLFLGYIYPINIIFDNQYTWFSGWFNWYIDFNKITAISVVSQSFRSIAYIVVGGQPSVISGGELNRIYLYERCWN